MTPCSALRVHRCSGQLTASIVRVKEWAKQTVVIKLHASKLTSCLAYSSTSTEAVLCSKMSVNFYQCRRRYILEDCTLRSLMLWEPQVLNILLQNPKIWCKAGEAKYHRRDMKRATTSSACVHLYVTCAYTANRASYNIFVSINLVLKIRNNTEQVSDVCKRVSPNWDVLFSVSNIHTSSTATRAVLRYFLWTGVQYKLVKIPVNKVICCGGRNILVDAWMDGRT